MSNNLPELFSELDESTRILQGQIETARSEIATAQKEISDRELNQVQLRTEIASLNTQILQAPPGQPQRRTELQATKTAQEQTLAQTEPLLAELRLRLSNLLSTRNEELARQRLESQYGLALVRIQALLNTVHDPAVRCLFAQHALTSFAQRKIDASAFDSITEQAKAQEVLTDLARLTERTGEVDRTEAARFDALNSFHKEISASSSSYSELQHSTDQRRSELEKTAQELEKQIAELSRPASATEVRSRQLWVVGSFVIAGLALVVAVVLILTGGEAALFSILLFVIGAIAAFLGWRSTDRFRASQLTGQRKALQEAREGIQEAKESSSRALTDALRRAQEYNHRLREFGAEPTKPSGPAENPFLSRMVTARVLLEAWLTKHPDIKVVLGSSRI